LKSSTPDANLHTYDGPPGCEETEELGKELLGYLARRDSREARGQWKSANETISDIAIIDGDTGRNIVSVNNTAKRVFGWPGGDTPCSLEAFLFGAGTSPRLTGVLDRIGIEQVQLRNERWTHKLADGGQVEIAWSTTNLYDVDGVYSGKRLFGGIAGEILPE
jgi:PAS domain-containing protein